MPKEQEPYSWAYDVEDDDFGDDLAHEDLLERDEFGFEEFGCCIPERCCTPGPHSPSECVSAEMMQDLFTEADAARDPDTIDQPMPEPGGDPF